MMSLKATSLGHPHRLPFQSTNSAISTMRLELSSNQRTSVSLPLSPLAMSWPRTRPKGSSGGERQPKLRGVVWELGVSAALCLAWCSVVKSMQVPHPSALSFPSALSDAPDSWPGCNSLARRNGCGRGSRKFQIVEVPTGARSMRTASYMSIDSPSFEKLKPPW